MTTELSKSLKSTMLGGYDRESVLLYIRHMMDTSQAEISQLHSELDKAQALNNELSEQNRQLYTAHSQIAEKIGEQSKCIEQMLAQNNELRARLDGYREREEALELREQEAASILDTAARKADAMLSKAQWEQEQMNQSALEQQRKILDDASGRFHMIGQLAQEIGQVVLRADYAIGREE